MFAPMCNEVVNIDIKGAKIQNLRFFEKLPELNWLELEQCQIKDFDGLGIIKNLELLNIRRTSISDLRDLESFANLKTLDIRQIPAKDYSPLLNLDRN